MRKVLVMVLTTVVAVQALSGLTAVSAPAVLATGTWEISLVPDSPVELIPQGQHCLVRAEVMVTYTGTLEGVTHTVGLQGNLWFATCDELVASGIFWDTARLPGRRAFRRRGRHPGDLSFGGAC